MKLKHYLKLIKLKKLIIQNQLNHHLQLLIIKVYLILEIFYFMI